MNYDLIPYRRWKLALLHCLAKAVGVLIHVDGIPLGRSPRSFKSTVFGARH